jgi:hypothetical protein
MGIFSSNKNVTRTAVSLREATDFLKRLKKAESDLRALHKQADVSHVALLSAAQHRKMLSLATRQPLQRFLITCIEAGTDKECCAAFCDGAGHPGWVQGSDEPAAASTL